MSDKTLNLFWNAIFSVLYLNYDTSKEFLSQFQRASEKLTSLCQEIMRTTEEHPNGKAGGGGNAFEDKLKWYKQFITIFHKKRGKESKFHGIKEWITSLKEADFCLFIYIITILRVKNFKDTSLRRKVISFQPAWTSSPGCSKLRSALLMPAYMYINPVGIGNVYFQVVWMPTFLNCFSSEGGT